MLDKKLYSSILKTPLGNMIAVADDVALYYLGFDDAYSLDQLQTKMKSRIILNRNSVIESIENEIKLYFDGQLQEFKTPLQCVGTPFQKNVWHELIKIPYGETRSYLQLAKSVGNPLAFRAAAQANGANQIVIVIPCHRVINANGRLGGYSSGISRKKWLLEHEGKSVSH